MHLGPQDEAGGGSNQVFGQREGWYLLETVDRSLIPSLALGREHEVNLRAASTSAPVAELVPEMIAVACSSRPPDFALYAATSSCPSCFTAPVVLTLKGPVVLLTAAPFRFNISLNRPLLLG